ncbi:precorrin-6y C5,15-methyltransferase (decarboxylating) subunit CbiE [Romeria aff. gracilis LEGE 07310]|uniref:Precorrin-6y C5,15-methyltransferase (Decarboxylating) subunit CbiE n=1 Tax=Vasconcelosia minhoensis LEGE 07310 TaxID=915328 RepID=A0A8J7AM18_9CYAN|nr:precorrin-6y C5,15-methyltransferase (decarboxylating) subunit CbiE [Romeria gracilis]MBE9077475.1 precorrin-6y C5,15-methyltransferase (decarboxylating) subunit CbiE [Romeria aff. gracilis LEGE 07310]
MTAPVQLIQVVGIGLNGAESLALAEQQRVEQAELLIGSDRHLAYFPNHAAEKWRLADFQSLFEALKARLATASPPRTVILTSGDPLFFGLGRLLLAQFPAEQLAFHPHPSSVQLAFSRLKLPWQDAHVVSVHGRSPEALVQALKRGTNKIAVLTDSDHTPAAIAALLLDLELPFEYRIWVCENLGGEAERVQFYELNDLRHRSFAPLNVVVLLRQIASTSPVHLPLIGLPDAAFLSFEDRPGLITKREVRLLILGAIAPLPGQTIWDIGAGTGSVSIEIARLCPTAHLYAIEQTAMGTALIQQNAQRLGTPNLTVVSGRAPAVLRSLPSPDRAFIGGSQGELDVILDSLAHRLSAEGRIVIALATLEHLAQLTRWIERSGLNWQHQLLQINLARSVAVGPLTRLSPLNPVMLSTLFKPAQE